MAVAQSAKVVVACWAVEYVTATGGKAVTASDYQMWGGGGDREGLLGVCKAEAANTFFLSILGW